MKRGLLISTLLLATALSGTASAGDPVVGAIIGGGAGAIVGHAVGGRDGALVGGAIGAATGVALATDRNRNNTRETYYERDRDDDRYDRRTVVYERPRYAPPPRVVVYERPEPRHITYVRTTYVERGPHWDRGYHRGWKHDRWDRDDRNDRWDRDDNRGHRDWKHDRD